MEILLNMIFIKENPISSLRKSSSPFFLKEFKLLILLKTKDGFTSLLHIIFIIPMTVNDVNLYVSFRGVSGLSS
jgi:hypothetical protein